MKAPSYIPRNPRHDARTVPVRKARPRPKVCAVTIPPYEVSKELEGSELRARLIELGIITPITARQPTVEQDDIGRFEAANGIFYSEGRGVVQGTLADPAADPGVRAALQTLMADPLASEARESMFQPGGGKVRWERFPHPAPEEDDTTVPARSEVGVGADGRSCIVSKYPPIGLPSPERGALSLVMSAKEVRAIPGMDERGRWLGTARVAYPALVKVERSETADGAS